MNQPYDNTASINNHPEGRYANYFKVGYNAHEFVIDFIQTYSEDDKMPVNTRIITNPFSVIALLDTLKESIEQYESCFGKIIKED